MDLIDMLEERVYREKWSGISPQSCDSLINNYKKNLVTDLPDKDSVRNERTYTKLMETNTFCW